MFTYWSKVPFAKTHSFDILGGPIRKWLDYSSSKQKKFKKR